MSQDKERELHEPYADESPWDSPRHRPSPIW